MYLVDTNIWLERLLDQEKSHEVGQFLEVIPLEELFITDFSFHSIGIVLTKLGQFDTLRKFTQDVFIEGAIPIIHLEPEDVFDVVSTMKNFNLDFDDAYQYVAARKYNLELVSFDSDFDRTIQGRKTPGDILRNQKVGDKDS